MYMYFILSIAVCLRALWAADEKRDMCWQLDPTEGPQRVRRRMMRAPTTVHEKHLLSDGLKRRKRRDNGAYMYTSVEMYQRLLEALT